MTYEQQQIADKFWENYQTFRNTQFFNNHNFKESTDFYNFQNYMNSQNSMLVYPILDYYIDYGATNDYYLLVYLLYSPFIWENRVYRYQLSKLLHHIKTNELIAGFVLLDEFDDLFLGLALDKSRSISIAHGANNSLNLWFYLGSYNLITDSISVEIDIDLHENAITDFVHSFYMNCEIVPEEVDDYYTVTDAWTTLIYAIYDISLHKAFQSDYTKDFLEELNNFVQYMYKNANKTIQTFFKKMYSLNKAGGLISDEYYNFYNELFIKYGYNIKEDIFPGILMLTRMLEDVVDYFLANIPAIYRSKSGYIQLSIAEYLKIFHCLFGVGTHELYAISNS